MEYYGPEPDQWKETAEPELKAAGAPEHFMDLEWADLIGGPLPRKRYDFIRALAYAQKAHPELPMTPENIGLQPYAIDEGYERLKAAMREYRGLAAAHKETRAGRGGDCVSGGDAGALGGGWVAAAAYDDAVQRLDGAESAWVHDRTHDSCAV